MKRLVDVAKDKGEGIKRIVFLSGGLAGKTYHPVAVIGNLLSGGGPYYKVQYVSGLKKQESCVLVFARKYSIIPDSRVKKTEPLSTKPRVLGPNLMFLKSRKLLYSAPALDACACAYLDGAAVCATARANACALSSVNMCARVCMKVSMMCARVRAYLYAWWFYVLASTCGVCVCGVHTVCVCECMCGRRCVCACARVCMCVHMREVHVCTRRTRSELQNRHVFSPRACTLAGAE